jgi:hypothetical protein
MTSKNQEGGEQPFAFHPMMAADEIERADEATVAPAIAQAAFDPALAVAEELQ